MTSTEISKTARELLDGYDISKQEKIILLNGIAKKKENIDKEYGKLSIKSKEIFEKARENYSISISKNREQSVKKAMSKIASFFDITLIEKQNDEIESEEENEKNLDVDTQEHTENSDKKKGKKEKKEDKRIDNE